MPTRTRNNRNNRGRKVTSAAAATGANVFADMNLTDQEYTRIRDNYYKTKPKKKKHVCSN